MTVRRLLIASLVLAPACSHSETPLDAARPGDPLPTITERELGRFLLGKALFERLTIPEEGLGPLFNEERCSACHNVPVSGGSGAPLVIKATRFENETCDLLQSQGGDNIQRQAIPALAAEGITGEQVPPDATARARVTGPSLFGLGLVEAIPDSIIAGHADPNDADGDGISGRAVYPEGGRLGRFGRKNEQATIGDFIDTALRFELGLTTPAHPMEESINGRPLPPGIDGTPEPELDERGFALLTDYVRFLAPPARETPASGAVRDSIEQGAAIFDQAGCTGCHTPRMATGASDVEALSNRAVPLYSDLLLHDMGDAMADVCGPNASPSEYRTARLWGLRYRSALMHDGRAASILEAIGFHGGEGDRALVAFTNLSERERAMLLRFLASL